MVLIQGNMHNDKFYTLYALLSHFRYKHLLNVNVLLEMVNGIVNESGIVK